MPRGKKSPQVHKLYSFLPQTNDIVRFEVDEDDAVIMKPGQDRQGFINGGFEFVHPLALIIARRSLFAPGLEVLAFQVFHRDIGVLLIIIDVRSIIRGNQRPQIVHGQDVLEIGQFEAETHVGTVADFVRFAATQIKHFDDDARLGGLVNPGLGVAFQEVSELHFAQTDQINGQSRILVCR